MARPADRLIRLSASRSGSRSAGASPADWAVRSWAATTSVTAAEFLTAGAFALGVGSDLVDAKAMAAGKPEVVTETAKKYLAIVKEFRASQAKAS